MTDETQARELPVSRLFEMYQAYEDQKLGEIEDARIARKYYHGKQWTDAELTKLKQRDQPAITNNRIKRKVDFLVGMEQRLRSDPKAYPRNPNDDEAAEVATASLRYVTDKEMWPQKASNAVHDGLVTGYGGLFVGVKRSGNKIEVDYRPISPNMYFYDPRSEMADFSDKRYDGLRKWEDIDEVIGKFPDNKQDLLNALDTDAGLFIEDQDKEWKWIDRNRRQVHIIEMYYKRGDEWYYCIFTGPIKLRSGISLYKDEDGKSVNPIETWAAYVDEEGDRYGMIRDMKGPQDEINHRRSKLLHMLNVRQTKGEKGAVSSVREMKAQLARADGHVETLPQKQWDIIDQRDQVQGQADLLAESKAEIENLGPNPGLIGRGVEKQSGRAILAQQNAGMTELSPVFDRLRDWKIRVYRATWLRIRQFWTDERYIRVTDNDGSAQFIGLNQLVGFDQTGQPAIQNPVVRMDMDIILEEGPDTITIQEEVFERLANLAGSGMEIPFEAMIEMAGLPSNVRDRVLQKMNGGDPEDPANQAQLQAAQQQQQLAEAEQVAKIEKTHSEVEKNRASAAKIESEIPKQRADTAMAVRDLMTPQPQTLQ